MIKLRTGVLTLLSAASLLGLSPAVVGTAGFDNGVAFDGLTFVPEEACTLPEAGADPMLTTLFGGSKDDIAYDVVLASDGGMVITGQTKSPDLQVSQHAAQPLHGGGNDAYVAKFRADGSLVFSTYLGGSGSDYAVHMVPLADGRVAVIGNTESSNFPVTAAAYQTRFGGGVDVFITILSATGVIEYSTLFGSEHGDFGSQIAVDSVGDLIFTGWTGGTLRTTVGAISTAVVKTTAYVAKLRASTAGASGLGALATIGGDDWDWARAITVDAADRVFIAGNTESSNFPVTGNAVQSTSGGFCIFNWPDCGDAFVTVLDANLSSILYSTYLGTTSDTSIYAMGVDERGGLYVGGRSYSGALAFPVTRRTGNKDGFVAKLQPFGTGEVEYITFVGGRVADLVMSPGGSLTAAVSTFRDQFTPTPGAPDMGPIGGNNENAPVVVDLDPLGAVAYGNFALQGIRHGHIWAITADLTGRQYIAGTSNSVTFPISFCGLREKAVGSDGFLATLPARRRDPPIAWTPAGMIYGATLGAAQLSATSEVTGTFVYSPSSGTRLAAGAHSIQATFTPADPTRYYSATVTRVVVVAPAPLTITAVDAVREFGEPNPPFSASFAGLVAVDSPASLDGTLTFATDAAPNSPVGEYPISVSGLSSPNYVVTFVSGTLRVVDTTPPVINGVTTNVTTLWAPNHQMVPIGVSVAAHDAASSFVCQVTSVASNEPVDGTGDGDTGPDWEITGDSAVNLRSERAGNGSGRLYTITVTCRDAFANVSAASATVAVPRNGRR